LCVENDVLAYPFVVDLAGVCLTRDMEGDGNEWRVQNMEAGGGLLATLHRRHSNLLILEGASSP